MATSGKMWQTTIVCFLALLCTVSCKPQQKPRVITEDNWRDVLEGEWLVKFYAPWCPACKALAPTWEKVAGWEDDLNFKVGHVDVTENPGLSGRFLVMSLPTIIHVKDGEFRTYRGNRDENRIVSFIDDKEWQSIEPIPWYKSPNSPQMSAIGMFFQAAMHVRTVHTSMTEEYGVPVWGSYAIFAVLTIFVGLLLGLLLVCLCDTAFPPRPSPEPRQYKALHREGTNHIANDIKTETDWDNDSDIIEDDRQEPVGAEDEAAGGDNQHAGETTARKRKPRTE